MTRLKLSNSAYNLPVWFTESLLSRQCRQNVDTGYPRRQRNSGYSAWNCFQGGPPFENATDESLNARPKQINVGYLFKVYRDNWDTAQKTAEAIVGRKVFGMWD
jgi:hypothetical protein